MAAVYLTLAVLATLCLGCIACVKGDELQAAANGRPAATARLLPLGCALLAVLCFYVALGGVWTFMAQIAIGSGITLDAASSLIGIATIFGVLSSLASTLVGEHRLGKYFVLAGFAVMAVSISCLFGTPGLLRFVAAAVLFKIAWSWLLPFLLAEVSRVGGAQVMNAANLAIGGGLAIGPLLAGSLIQASSGFATMLGVALAILGVAVISSVAVFRASDARASAPEESASRPVGPVAS